MGLLSDDKATLATCMRASLRLNEIIAPLLYRSIHVTSKMIKDHRHPLALPEFRGLHRLSPTKAANMSLVEFVTVDRHKATGCQEAIGPMTTKRASHSPDIVISCLRFNLGQSVDIRPRGIHLYGRAMSDMRCGILSRFRPKVLVFNEADCADPTFSCRIPTSGVDTVVAISKGHIMEGCDCGLYGRGLPRRSVPIEHMFYIIWERVSSSNSRCASYLPYCHCVICDHVDTLEQNIESGFAKSYTIVNGGPDLERILRSTRSEALSQCSFITKDEYLRDQEWKGVLTPQEVHRWTNM